MTRTSLAGRLAHSVSRRIDLPVPGGATSSAGPRLSTAKVSRSRASVKLAWGSSPSGGHGAIEGQRGEAEVVQEFVEGRHGGPSFRASADWALR